MKTVIRLLENKRLREGALVLILFAGITFLQIFPLSLKPLNTVHDPGDPLLNTWILSRVSDALVHNPFRLFEANIFYPYHGTLAFSEHMLPLAVISAPLYFLSRNPVLGYNFILFLSFILNAFGMYLLVRHLTGNKWAGIFSGIIFAFNSYKIMHISHLQLLASMGIPWSFLYLHKWLVEKTWKNSLLFAFFFVLQALSCVYYGLFSMAIFSLILPLFLLFYFKKLDVSSLIKLGVPLVFAGGILYLFSLPYAQVFRALGLKRALTAGAEVQNYLAIIPTNLLFGKLLSGLGTHEKFLFPGLAACVLMLTAVIKMKKNALKAVRSGTAHLISKTVKVVLAVFAAGNLLSIIAVLAGGVRLEWGRFKFSANRLEKPVLYLFVLCFLFLVAKVVGRLKTPQEGDQGPWILGYSILTFWAMLLSFGAGFTLLGKTTTVFPLPFSLFFRYAKGFSGIREPARFAVFVIFGISVLAGFGYDRMMRRVTKRALKIVLAGALLVFVNIEYLSIPLEGVAVPVGKDVPPTYEWLKAQRKEAVVLELPFSEWLPGESLYVYFSTYHKKRLVNGYSGFIPASTYHLRETFKEFPDRECRDLLEALHVEFVVFHAKKLPPEFVQSFAKNIETLSGGELRLVQRFQYAFSRQNAFQDFLGDDLVFSFRADPAQRRPGEGMEPAPLAAVPSGRWQVTVGHNQPLASLLTDKNLSSAWTSGQPIRPGEFIQIDLGEARNIRRISLFAGASYYDYGLDFRVEASADGRRWRPVPVRYSKAEFCLALIKDQVHASQNLRLDDGPLRYLKIIQMGTNEAFPWSVSELQIFESLRPDEEPGKSGTRKIRPGIEKRRNLP